MSSKNKASFLAKTSSISQKSERGQKSQNYSDVKISVKLSNQDNPVDAYDLKQ